MTLRSLLPLLRMIVRAATSETERRLALRIMELIES